jgi:hypothetical protein
MAKLPHYYCPWHSLSENRDKFEMLPLETKQSGGKLLRQGVTRRNISQNELQKEGLQIEAEGTPQPHEWNLERKYLESSRKIR